MSEEEIIKDLNKYIELINKEYCDECNELNVISGKYCNGSRNVALAIQGLLDLYKKEKRKTKLNITDKQLKEAHDYFVNYTFLGDKTAEYIMVILNALYEEKEKNKKLERINSALKTNYDIKYQKELRKNKKLEKNIINESQKLIDNKENDTYAYLDIENAKRIIEVLEDLLED